MDIENMANQPLVGNNEKKVLKLLGWIIAVALVWGGFCKLVGIESSLCGDYGVRAQVAALFCDSYDVPPDIYLEDTNTLSVKDGVCECEGTMNVLGHKATIRYRVTKQSGGEVVQLYD